MPRTVILIIIVAVMSAGLAGCAKDSQVMVTPFVLKPTECAHVPQGPPPADLKPCTRQYEQAVIAR